MSTTTLTAHPSWCGGCAQVNDGTRAGYTEHRGIGYPVTIMDDPGKVVPLIIGGERIVDVNVRTGHLTPAEARHLARALEVIATTVEDAVA